jgi:hypothetical protein
MQTVRFVIDSDASVAPFVYTFGQNAEICEINVLTTAAVGFVLTVRNGANSITTVTSGGVIGDIDVPVTLAPAYIDIAAGGTLTVQTNAAGARCIVSVYILPGVTATS